MCDIVVDKRLHGVLEVKDMQDGNNVDKISLPARARDHAIKDNDTMDRVLSGLT